MTEHRAVDVSPQRAALAALAGPDAPAAAGRITDDAARHAPPVLMAAAAVMFAAGERERGAFWFYAAQLRARIDARRCTDPSAAAACGVLTQTYGPPVNRWAFAEPGLLPGLVDRVVAWDAATPRDYDHRWIALHGMGAFLGRGEPVSVPEETWPALAAQVREEYAAGCRALFDRP